MSSRVPFLLTIALTLGTSSAFSKQGLTPADLATPGQMAQLKPPLCTCYQIDHIGFGGHWLALDDGSTWLVDENEGWRLSYYINGQRVVLVRDGHWMAPRFELVFGSQQDGIPVIPLEPPQSDTFRYRSIERWSEDGSKMRLSDGSWWCADITGVEAQSFRELKPETPVLLTCRRRWWSSQAAVALLDTTSWHSYAVRAATPEKSSDKEIPAEEGFAAEDLDPQLLDADRRELRPTEGC